MSLVLSDIRRPTFTTCACVTSQIAKSFLFDRRSDLLSFRLVARPPPTQDPAHLLNYLPRILTAPTISKIWLSLFNPDFFWSIPPAAPLFFLPVNALFPDLRTVHIYVDSMSRVSSTTTFSSAFYNHASLAASGSLWLCQYA